MGVARFGTWAKDLSNNEWESTVDLYCGSTHADLGLYTIEARFYSTEVAP